MALTVALNRLFRLCKKVFFGVIGFGVATIVVLGALTMVTKGSGNPWLQHLVHSDGFFRGPSRQ